MGFARKESMTNVHIVGLAGVPGSGKSAVARSLSEALHWQSASFGAYVRSMAEQRGLSGDRRALQDLGEALIQEFGWRAFCRNALNYVQWTTGESGVIDGIRHREAWETLQDQLRPDRATLVFVDVPSATAESRLTGRGENVAIEEVLSHPNESQSCSILRVNADLVVSGTDDVEQLTKSLINNIGHHAEF